MTTRTRRSSPRADRLIPALMGTAFGDSWGYPYTLPPQPTSTPQPEDPVISDDTQMSLALIAAMDRITSRGLARVTGMQEIAYEFMDFNRDADNDRFPGRAVVTALDLLDELGPEHWPKATTHSGGCGSIMRLTPAALLADEGTQMGWAVTQGLITHNSPLARASTVMLTAVLLAEPTEDLIDVARGVASNPLLTEDRLLTDEEKESLTEDVRRALVHDIPGQNRPVLELLDMAARIREHVSPTLADGDTSDVLAEGRRITEVLGRSWDAGSALTSVVLLSQLYLDNWRTLPPEDMIHVAVNWPGNRNSRASLVGSVLGTLTGVDWERDGATPAFEDRYDAAIRSGVWRGFSRQ
ncbi:hypothetical protein CXF45_08320 [Corynebacterium bovis]|uniref:ADP-ribosylglycohydrolase family protein n=1 Tax=Corynebacterium bovis TaxID=36808 RepID=UPI000F64D19C|nr:ADP-ribosylglycohydrolase family protein [Corynebacterium bovis]RRO80464.1 hypothetical protein CXF38_06535 [Corynebacterium bovis]RRO88906.1 hypothetical protein CXF45_08320 [Corynebacterium bovis]